MRRGAVAAAGWVSVLVSMGAALIVVAWVAPWGSEEQGRGRNGLAAFSTDRRPQPNGHLFDYTGDLEHYEEGVHRFLSRMSERFHIEAVIVTLPALPAETYLEEVAVGLVDRWRIGAGHSGRGLLLLLVEDDRQVKLEVTYELEDVFTDAFTAHVQDLQLRPYYREGDLGTGLIAVMEELEQRAELKRLAEYTPRDIATLDAQLLSGGGGARRDLQPHESERSSVSTSMDEPIEGARSPEEAWNIMVSKWAGTGADIDVDIYTEITKLEMGDPNEADPRTRRSADHWKTASYQVLQDADHAVIWFGNLDGWNNAPFLFCRTPTGWKFDIVHQRRLVVMAESPKWMIEQGPYPYVELLAKAPQSLGKDLPLPLEDRYSCQADSVLARQIRELEKERLRSPDDVGVLMALARLNVIVGRRPNHVIPLLERLRKLTPNDPDVYKYAAIYNVFSFFQYETALEDMRAYVKLRPDDAFGHSFLGFLYYRLANYETSIESLERAIEISPDNAYADALLARDYARLHRAGQHVPTK